jgi:hypothetical protein
MKPYSLIVKTVNIDRTSVANPNFRYPESGPVSCEFFDTISSQTNGLFGQFWGFGTSCNNLLEEGKKHLGCVLVVNSSNIIHYDNKSLYCKVDTASEVIFFDHFDAAVSYVKKDKYFDVVLSELMKKLTASDLVQNNRCYYVMDILIFSKLLAHSIEHENFNQTYMFLLHILKNNFYHKLKKEEIKDVLESNNLDTDIVNFLLKKVEV